MLGEFWILLGGGWEYRPLLADPPAPSHKKQRPQSQRQRSEPHDTQETAPTIFEIPLTSAAFAPIFGLYTLPRWGVTWCRIGRFARDMYEQTASTVRCDISVASGVSYEISLSMTCNTPPQGVPLRPSLCSLGCRPSTLTAYASRETWRQTIQAAPNVNMPLLRLQSSEGKFAISREIEPARRSFCRRGGRTFTEVARLVPSGTGGRLCTGDPSRRTTVLYMYTI